MSIASSVLPASSSIGVENKEADAPSPIIGKGMMPGGNVLAADGPNSLDRRWEGRPGENGAKYLY